MGEAGGRGTKGQEYGARRSCEHVTGEMTRRRGGELRRSLSGGPHDRRGSPSPGRLSWVLQGMVGDQCPWAASGRWEALKA